MDNKDNYKNIQLSEKLEYLMVVGKLAIVETPDRVTRYVYSCPKFHISAVQSGGRLLDFVNNVVEQYGIYPLIQKFHKRKENGATTTLC